MQQAKTASLTRGRHMFIRMARETDLSAVELKKAVQTLIKRTNPFLGIILKIEIMSRKLDSCKDDCEKEQNQLYDLYMETFFMFEWMGDEEGLRLIKQIKTKYPRALRMLDYQVGNA